MTDARSNKSSTTKAHDESAKPQKSKEDSASLKPVDDGRSAPAGDLPQSNVDLTSPKQSSTPPMPHERDEAVGMTGGVPSKRVQQAKKDVDQGRQDTSRGTEADQTYQRQKDSS